LNTSYYVEGQSVMDTRCDPNPLNGLRQWHENEDLTKLIQPR
jgi:hypothetical protein